MSTALVQVVPLERGHSRERAVDKPVLCCCFDIALVCCVKTSHCVFLAIAIHALKCATSFSRDRISPFFLLAKATWSNMHARTYKSSCLLARLLASSASLIQHLPEKTARQAWAWCSILSSFHICRTNKKDEKLPRLTLVKRFREEAEKKSGKSKSGNGLVDAGKFTETIFFPEPLSPFCHRHWKLNQFEINCSRDPRKSKLVFAPHKRLSLGQLLGAWKLLLLFPACAWWSVIKLNGRPTDPVVSLYPF